MSKETVGNRVAAPLSEATKWVGSATDGSPPYLGTGTYGAVAQPSAGQSPAPFRVFDPVADSTADQIGDFVIPYVSSPGNLQQLSYPDLVLPAVVSTQPWTLIIGNEGVVNPVGDRLPPTDPEEDSYLPILPNAQPGTFKWERQRQLEEEYQRRQKESPNTDPHLVRASGQSGAASSSEGAPQSSQTAGKEHEVQWEAIKQFLGEKEKSLKDVKFEQLGISFCTEDGEYFVPTESIEFVAKHPELLIENGVQWQNTGIHKDGLELKFIKIDGKLIIDSSQKLTKAQLADGDWVFRKDYRYIGDYSWQYVEARNFSTIGGQVIKVSPTVSFRVPRHYAATPHGIIMEYTDAPTLFSALKGMDETTAAVVIQQYKELRDYVRKYRSCEIFRGDYNALFCLPHEPLNRDEMGMTMTFLEGYSKDGESRFIITDLKGR